MENDYFINAEFSSQLYFQPSLSALQDQNHIQNPNFDKPMQHHSPFVSALSSMVSSPSAALTSATDSFAIRELIGKLGTICSSSEISSELLQGSTYINGENNSPNTSCYNTPMDSPPLLHLPVMNRFMQENVPNLGNPMAMNSALPELSSDPGFAARAAKFSCFGSRSLNGRTNQVGLNSAGFQYRSNNRTGNGKLPRVSSSPSLKEAESPMSMHVNTTSVQAQREMRSANASVSNSNEESCIPQQNPTGENGITTPKELNSRKRKSISRGKAKEAALSQPVNAIKGAEGNKNLDVKRSKATGDGGNDNGKSVKSQEDQNQKTPEPPKDYIHVRARRGQATDSHSLAERVRREKIGERMKLLQDLVPSCSKVTGKALLLDEIINYVQSLQRQVEFLSMKLATVNPEIDINMDRVMPKDKFQPNGAFLNQNFPVNSSASAYYGHQVQQMPQMHKLMEPLDATFGEGLPQFPAFYEDDLLQSLVQMGYGTNQTTHMKREP